MKTKIYLLISLFALIACKTSITNNGQVPLTEKGLLPISLKVNSNEDGYASYHIRTINDTILWATKKFSYQESDCNFIKELFSDETVVLSYSPKFDNSMVSGSDNSKRQIMFFVDLISEKVLKIEFEEYVRLSAFKSRITNATEHRAILNVDFDNNVLILLDGSGNELNYDLIEVTDFPLNCQQ